MPRDGGDRAGLQRAPDRVRSGGEPGRDEVVADFEAPEQAFRIRRAERIPGRLVPKLLGFVVGRRGASGVAPEELHEAGVPDAVLGDRVLEGPIREDMVLEPALDLADEVWDDECGHGSQPRPPWGRSRFMEAPPGRPAAPAAGCSP